MSFQFSETPLVQPFNHDGRAHLLITKQHDRYAIHLNELGHQIITPIREQLLHILKDALRTPSTTPSRQTFTVGEYRANLFQTAPQEWNMTINALQGMIHTISERCRQSNHPQEILNLIFTSLNRVIGTQRMDYITYDHSTRSLSIEQTWPALKNHALLPHTIPYQTAAHPALIGIEEAIQNYEQVAAAQNGNDHVVYYDGETLSRRYPQTHLQELCVLPIAYTLDHKSSTHPPLRAFLRLVDTNEARHFHYLDSLCTISSILTNKLKALATINHLNEQTNFLNRTANIDELTNLFNRRYERKIDLEIERADRYKHPLALLFIDIDHFKSVNDQYNHTVGDMVLKELGGIIKESLRKSDLPFRHGGDEFIVLLPETDHQGALELATRLKQQIDTYQFGGSAQLNISVSIGIAERQQEKTAKELIERADHKMYTAKHNGRDMIVT